MEGFLITRVRKTARPRSISFQGTVQTLEAFQPIIAIQGKHNTEIRMLLYQQLLDVIAVNQVADRPNRFEPRLLKRRPKHYAFLAKPRDVVKRQMAKGVKKIQVPFVDKTEALWHWIPMQSGEHE